MFRTRDLWTCTLMASACALLPACGDGTDPAGGEVGRIAQRDVSNRNFGVHCTSYYEADWKTPLSAGWTICNNLSARLDDEATHEFSYSLYQKKDYWETSGDGADNSLEDVDLFFAFTYGATNTVDAGWAMYDVNDWALSSNMSLGNELRGTSIFATYSGYTLKVDAYTWNRWDSVFNGGLRMALGSHGAVYSGAAEYDLGDVFAQYLNAGYTFKTAWSAAFDLTPYNNQDVAVMATGTSSSNCTTRRDNLSWDNFSYSSYPRLTGTSIGAWCGWTWENI